MILLFDAANTLIYKPTVYSKFFNALMKENYNVTYEKLIQQHKLVSEIIEFPDVTSKEFYKYFNAEVLYSLGIIPTDKLLDILHNECSYLPWEKYNDVAILSEIKIPKFILSNFNKTLNQIIENEFPNVFEKIICSEIVGLRKPDINLFFYAIEELKIKKNESIIYVGDSLKLDINPASKAGMNAWLIDRNGYYNNYPKRLNTLFELKKIINDPF